MKKLFIFALVLASLFVCVRAAHAEKPEPKHYPQAAVVVDLDYADDLVTVETATGFQYQFFGCEDYSTGDLVSMILSDAGTPDITDDAIIQARYTGFHK